MTNWKNKELLQIGWNKTRENFWFLLTILVCAQILSFVGQKIHIGFVVDIFTSFVLTGVFLQIARDKKVDYKNLFDSVSVAKIFQYFLATIIASVFLVVGLALFIVPGIIVGLSLAFLAYILIDEDKNIYWKSLAFWRAIKKSFSMTKGIRWKLFGFFLVLLGLNILGALAFVIGLLVTIPVSGMAMAVLYDRLRNRVVETTTVVAGNISEIVPSEIAN